MLGWAPRAWQPDSLNEYAASRERAPVQQVAADTHGCMELPGPIYVNVAGYVAVSFSEELSVL